MRTLQRNVSSCYSTCRLIYMNMKSGFHYNVSNNYFHSCFLAKLENVFFPPKQLFQLIKTYYEKNENFSPMVPPLVLFHSNGPPLVLFLSNGSPLGCGIIFQKLSKKAPKPLLGYF